MAETTTPKRKNPFSCTINYYRDAGRIYWRNFWKFFIVGLAGAIIVNLTIWATQLYFEGKLGLPVPANTLNRKLLNFATRMIIAMIMNGFIGAIIGMGYDIMGSGDEFAQLRQIFYYIRKYWFKFFLIGFVVNVLVYAIPFLDFLYDTPDQFILLNYIVHALQILIYIFFYIFNPSIIFYPNFSEALKNTIAMFKKYFGRIVCSYFIYITIFFVPLLVMKFISLEIESDDTFWYISEIFNRTILFYDSDVTNFALHFGRVFWFWRFIIGFPFLSLVSLRINNEYQYEQNPDNFT
jgi:hypothetical protein